ncbi:Transcriptional regulator of nonfermentable carbon utilization [Myotisia sp. PD_48]|nr:Transcriptional regulator of nonfermentable carbon utilization [Myotisia sp. PD_48]
MTANAVEGPFTVSPPQSPASSRESDTMNRSDEPSRSGSQYIHIESEEPADSLNNGSQVSSSAANAKDPSRPKRKKAKRACYACQRGHLTCGDERPCQRCIKRGFQDACHDGVRKKAKYLHDAPSDALIPRQGAPLYNQRNPSRNGSSQALNGTNNSQKPVQHTTSPTFYNTQQSPPGFNGYSPAKTEGISNNGIPTDGFTSQSPISPTFQMSRNMSQTLSSSLPQSSNPSPSATNPTNSQFNTFFDPSDPALFNFDIASMNFGNHYGALEFGMLGHMATGVGDTPPSDTATQRGSAGRSNSGAYGLSGTNFSESPGNQVPYLFGESGINDWSQQQPSMNSGNIYGLSGSNIPDKPHAFAIESAPVNFTSPNSNQSPLMTTNAPVFDDSGYNTRQNNSNIPSNLRQQHPVVSTPQLKQQSLYANNKRRQRDPSAVYERVKEPYPYTTGFHSLTAFIQRRFSSQKTLRIAKALASIRPSFIATTKTLNRDDLIFMEKCFQRTLWEYEDFINACGTPTIVCRRTGEVAAVGKEFSILTGWKKEVLLGKEPNLNVNTGGNSGTATGTTSRGSYTPRGLKDPYNSNAPAVGRTQPVFLAELLDDDSVVEFYEDFAKLAFGDSRGSVMTTCNLLKYKTKMDTDVLSTSNNNGTGEPSVDTAGNGEVNSQQPSRQRKWEKGGIAGEAGMNQLGFRDGKVECSYCWTVKRDVFDIPMLIVMNVSRVHPFQNSFDDRSLVANVISS